MTDVGQIVQSMIRWIYYCMVPLTAAFTLWPFILYNKQLLNAGVGGKICWVWFLILTIFTVIQVPIHVGLDLIRACKGVYNDVKPKTKLLQDPNQYYKALNICTICLGVTSSIHGLFLIMVQFRLVELGLVDQQFTILFFVVWLIHTIIFLTRVVAAAEHATRDFFYIPFWGPEDARKGTSTAINEEVKEFSFFDYAKVICMLDGSVVTLGFLVTYTLTDYTPATDKITTFFHVWNPCILIDHYPASIIGIVLMSTREIFNALFQVMLFMYTYLRTGTMTTMAGAAVLTVSQIGLLVMVNAFSAGLYTEADKGVTAATYVFTETDAHNVSSHSAAYVSWMASAQAIFTYMVWLIVKFDLPFQTTWKKYAWGVFFVLSSIVVWTMCMTMGVAIVHASDSWVNNPQTFLQRYLVFTRFVLQFPSLMLIPSPIQRLIMPTKEGIRMKFTRNRNEGKHGSMGRPERLFCLIFWVLGILTFITYCLTTVPYSSDLLVPIAMGFRVKPFVYLFAPAWFFGCLALGYSIWLTTLRARLEQRTRAYMVTLRVVGMLLFASCFLCILIIIPLWTSSSPILVLALALLLCWIVLTQGLNRATGVYCSFYITLTLLSILHRPLAILWSVLLMLLLMCYGAIFPRYEAVEVFVTLEYGEVKNLNPVVELMKLQTNATSQNEEPTTKEVTSVVTAQSLESDEEQAEKKL